MAQTIPAAADLGPAYTSLAIGYRILNLDETEYSAFSTTGVAETNVLGFYRKDNGVVAPDAGAYIIWGVSGTDYIESTIPPAGITVAQVNAEVDTALADYDAPTKAELDAAQASIEADIAALNDLDATEAQAAAAAALTAYDPPTKAELDGAQSSIESDIAALNDLDSADIQIAAAAALTTYGAATGADVTTATSGLSTLTAQQVWEYADRALTSFGTLIADIWANAVRTITGGTATVDANAIADAVLSRHVENVEDAADIHTIAGLILAQFNSSAPGTTWTIYKSDGVTVFATLTLVEDAAAKPVTGVSA